MFFKCRYNISVFNRCKKIVNGKIISIESRRANMRGISYYAYIQYEYGEAKYCTCSQFGIKDENAFLEGDNIDIYVDTDNSKVFIDEKSREYGNERKFMYIRMIDTIVFFILLMAFNIYIYIN